MTLFENMQNATILLISVKNTWRLVKHHYFPIPLGVKMSFKFHKPIILRKMNLEEAFFKVVSEISDGVNLIKKE